VAEGPRRGRGARPGPRRRAGRATEVFRRATTDHGRRVLRGRELRRWNDRLAGVPPAHTSSAGGGDAVGGVAWFAPSLSARRTGSCRSTRTSNLARGGKEQRRRSRRRPAGSTDDPTDPRPGEVVAMATLLPSRPGRCCILTPHGSSRSRPTVRLRRGARLRPGDALRFLEEGFVPDESDCRRRLQRSHWATLLTPDTKPAEGECDRRPRLRSGKGDGSTTLHVLLGPDSLLAAPHGRGPRGRLRAPGTDRHGLATVTDMRLGRYSYTSKLVRNLLRVSGEDRR